MKVAKIVRIVFTGGPCGGKTTALSYISQKLRDKGYQVFTVPESATICINGGLNPNNPMVGTMVAQSAIVSVAKSLEDTWIDAIKKLKTEKTVVILFDRGITDCQAYVDESIYRGAIQEHGLNKYLVRDSRYDAVIHLKTAADGAEEHYTLANNSARYESIEQARIQDSKVIRVWIGAPHFRVVDNRTDFEGKLRRVYAEVCSVLGIPVPIERERKFLVRFNPSDLPDHAQYIDIEQIYLNSPQEDTVIRIRKRGQDSFYTYYKTIKRRLNSMERFETEEIITAHEYNFGTSLVKRGTAPIRKTRTCFVYDSQYFELDLFHDQRVLPGRAMLEIELTQENSDVDIPSFLQVEREVTKDPNFENFNISRKLADEAA